MLVIICTMGTIASGMSCSNLRCEQGEKKGGAAGVGWGHGHRAPFLAPPSLHARLQKLAVEVVVNRLIDDGLVFQEVVPPAAERTREQLVLHVVDGGLGNKRVAGRGMKKAASQARWRSVALSVSPALTCST